MTRPVLAYPEFDTFGDLAIELILDGAASEEFGLLQRALALEMATLEPNEPSPSGEASTLELMRELMFTQNDLFERSGSQPAWVLARDSRGMASVSRDAGGAILAPFMDSDGDGLPDVDELGRFETIASVGSPAPFPILGESGVARDPSGRAIRADGSRYFEYFDANRTMLAGLLGEVSFLFDPSAPALIQMSRGLPRVLGTQQATSLTYDSYTLGYQAYETQGGALFDVVAAVGEMMHRPETEDALVVTEALMRDHESEVAGLMRAARYMANQADLHPEARLDPESILWDDLIRLVVRMSHQPGLLEALIRSFSDPRSAGLGETYGSFMRHRDRVTFDPSAPNATPIGLPLSQRVDRNAPDTFDNESLWQRTLALIDALDGVQVCNRAGARLNLQLSVAGFNFNLAYPLFGGTFDECELINIENAAEAYALTILGRYTLEMEDGFLRFLTTDAAPALGLGGTVDEALEVTSGIDGLTQMPTPQAMNRLIFWGLSDASGTTSCIPDSNGGNCNSDFAGQLFDPVRDRHGNLVVERYHGTIFAWEQEGFYEGMRPMLEVLHRPEYRLDEGGRYNFGQLLSTIHRHWASPENENTCGADEGCAPGDPNFSYQDDAKSYEELIAEGFIDGHVVERLHRLNLAMEQVEVRPGVDAIAALAGAAEALTDPERNVGLSNRRGQTTTPVNDGSRDVPLTPLYLLLDALNAMDAQMGAYPDDQREWRAGRRALAERFLATDTFGDGFRMRNQSARGVMLEALPFARSRLQAHRDAGDLLEWATDLDDDLAETMREPLFAALVQFLQALNEDEAARAAMADLVNYLMHFESDNDAFRSVVYGAADLMMVLEDDLNIVPLMHALSEAMAPNVRDVTAGSEPELDIAGSFVRDALGLVQDIQVVDEERVLRQILQNAVSIPNAGDEITPLEVIIDVIAEVNRAEPNAGGPLRVNDYRQVLGQATDFVLDEDHGMERLNGVVQHRQCFPEQATQCGMDGVTIESTGLCYVGATCTCAASGEMLRWQCQR